MSNLINQQNYSYNFFIFRMCREKLCGHLPARAEGYSWSLAFSTSQNGFSLNSLYRKLQRLESPILIVIQDTENNVSLDTSFEFNGNPNFINEKNVRINFLQRFSVL